MIFSKPCQTKALPTILFALLFTTVLSTPAVSENYLDKATVAEAKALIDSSLKSNIGFDIVESLTTEVGPRLAGSEAEACAREWGVAMLLGLSCALQRCKICVTRPLPDLKEKLYLSTNL